MSRHPGTVDVLLSEWTKIRTLRSTAYTLLLTAALGVGFGVIFALAGARKYAGMTPADRASFDPTSTSLAGHLVAQLGIGVLGVLVITSEHATGMIRTSLTAVPCRGRLLAAKALVFAAVSLTAGEAVGFGAFFVGQAVIAGQGAPAATLAQPHVLGAVVGAGLYLAVVGLLGVAVGALVRATAGALAIMVTVTLLVPAFVPALPRSWAMWLTGYWPTLAGGRVMNVVATPGALSPWVGFAVLCGSVAVVGALAWVLVRARDV
jgi:hypothetical protein